MPDCHADLSMKLWIWWKLEKVMFALSLSERGLRTDTREPGLLLDGEKLMLALDFSPEGSVDLPTAINLVRLKS